MEKSKSVHVVELNARAQNLQQALASLKKDFAGMVVPKDLEKVFVKLENSLDTIVRKTSKGIIPREDFQDTEKEIGKIRTAFDGLSTSMEGIKKAGDKKLLQMIPEGTVKKIEDVTKAYTEYAKEMTSVIAAEKALEAAIQKKSEAEQKVTSTQNSERAYKGKLTWAQNELAKHKEITEALEEQTQAAKELEDAEKALESARRSGKGEKAIANKQAKVDSAKERKDKADTIVAGFSQKELKAQKDAIDRVSTATEKCSIAKKNSEAAQKALTAAEVAAQTASNDLTRAKNKDANAAQSEANALKTLRDALIAVDPKYKNLEIQGKTTTQQLEFLRNTIDGLSDDELKKLKVSLEKADVNFEKFGSGVEETRDALARTKEEVKASDEALSQQGAFENRIKQFLGLQGAAQLMRRALRDAMQTITELDATMTEMAVVTDLGVGDYWDQLPEYSARANELGVAINDAYKAATLYYQQGLKTNEVNAISTETLKMAKIAGLSAAEATNKMTAALRGFNMELNETSAQRVADVYSELAAITAADTKEIANAMTKTASIASSAGMEFETTAAFLSQIIETTRESAETAGTALKTVIARFQELKKDPAEIGEVDGEIVDANAIETALRSVGVALRDSSGQFRELDDVFLELSSKWNDLDKNTQRYIATIAAGSRQQSRFIAMMQDYNRTQELVNAANNSAGASQKQFEKTTESLEYKINRLKNAWAEFTMGIMNSDLVKMGIDILTKLLEIVNKATSGFNGLAGSITKIIGIVAVFKLGKTIFDKLRTPMVKFFADIVKEAGITGEKAGNAAKAGVEKSKTQQSTQSSEEQPKTSKTGIVDFVKDKTGWSSFEEAKKASAEATRLRNLKSSPKEEYDKKQNRLDEIKNRYQFNDNGDIIDKNAKNKKGKIKPRKLDKRDAEQLKKEYADLNKEVEEYNNAEDNYAKASKKKWDAIGQGVQQAGQLVSGAGVAMSVFGGILSSLGLEEAGELLSQIGNFAMIAGTAISSLGPIITGIVGKLVAGGASTLAAWGWVGLIVAGIILLVSAVVGIISYINSNSPEKKLERAQKAVDNASEAANRAKDNFEELSSSLNGLDDKYKSIEDLTKGTDEWNKAVQEVNSSVLDLINKYPELAGFVENDGGLLTIDVDSDEVQDVINKYEKANVAAKGAEIGAKANLNRQQTEYDLNKMDDKIFDKFVTEDRGKGVATAYGNLLAATYAGIGTGAMIGAGTGAAIGSAAAGVGAAPGAAVGAIVGMAAGAVTGLTAGIATFQYTMDQVEKNNEQNRENVKELAQAYANGETGETVTEIAAYIERNGLAAGDAAKQMAESLLEESETMLEFGNSLNAMDAAQKSYYQAMATNAQQLIDLGSHTQQQIDQMSTVVDEDLMKNYEDDAKASIEEVAKTENSDNDNADWKEKKEEFIKQQYGENAKLSDDGKSVLDEKGETIITFENDDEWKAQMAAAEATLRAAEAMEMVPSMIQNGMNYAMKEFGAEAQKALEKAFSGESLTESELQQFKNTVGSESYNYTDAEGNLKSGTADEVWAVLSEQDQAVWGSKEAYLKSLDKDFSNIEAMWNNLSDREKETLYGLKEDGSNLEEAMERYEEQFNEVIEEQTKGFEKAKKNVKELGLQSSLSGKLNSEAQVGWTEELLKIAPANRDINGLQSQLNALLDSMSVEDANVAMAQINAIDKMDIDAWRQLEEVFDELNINYNTEVLENFVEKGIEVSGAIKKIDFSNLHNQINEAYKLLDKVGENSRTYSEEDYKLLIQSNKSLEKSFTQIGDKFYYTGAAITDLEDAVRQNTTALLQEANKQLNDKIAMAEIIAGKSNNYGSVEAMDKTGLIKYLTDMRVSLGEKGYNLSSLGKAGLDNSTVFSTASAEDLKRWAQTISALPAQLPTMTEEWTENMRKTNAQIYAQDNTAAYNAQMAAKGGAYANQHSEALIIQAIQSGGVPNALIEAYKQAVLDNDKGKIGRLGAQIADSIDQMIEDGAGKDAYSDLTDRLVDAIVDSRQKEIDKLSEVNDSINDANSQLISKIQEQIDEERQRRANEETEQNISDLSQKLAYLGMDTSGSNTLETLSVAKELENATQDYEDSLIDQALGDLNDANERAAEQRQEQINILQSQLDYERSNGIVAERAKQILDDSLTEIQDGVSVTDTALGQLLYDGEGVGALNEIAQKDWVSKLLTSTASAADYLYALSSDDKPGKTGEQGGSESDLGNKGPEKDDSDYLDANNKDKQSLALKEYDDAFKKYSSGEMSKGEFEEATEKARNNYTEAKGKSEDFDKHTSNKMDKFIAVSYGTNGKVSADDFNKREWDKITISIDGTDYKATVLGDYREKEPGWMGHAAIADQNLGKKINRAIEISEGIEGTVKPEQGWFSVYNGIPYVYRFIRDYMNGDNSSKDGSYAWVRLDNNPDSGTDKQYEAIMQQINYSRKHTKAFKTGGLADFTGPAWLDGTPSKPEYILNAAQTERFFSLIDVLERFDTDKKSSRETGDVTIDVDINVESISSDYDLERIANKIRNMIYDDAMYRNVHNIN